MKTFSRTIAALSVAVATSGFASGLYAADLPAKLAIAGASQGSINFAISAALATVITKKTPMQTTVVPHTGTAGIMPAVAKGDPPLGVTAGTPLTFKSYLKPEDFEAVQRNFRIVSAGTPNQITMAVLEGSDITETSDLRGKRLTARFSALPECQMHATALLRSRGLTWGDVREVPVTSIGQAARALQERRVDVMACASPAIRALREVNARTPVRFLSVDGSPEAMARAREVFPYFERATTLPKGAFGWLGSKTSFLTYPWYLYANKDLSDEVVYATVKAIWENFKDLGKIHPIMRGWTPKNIVIENTPVAYHEGAVRLFKEKGGWTDAHAMNQDKLLKQ